MKLLKSELEGRQRLLRQTQSDQDRSKVREYQREHQVSLRESETETQTAERLDNKQEHQVKLRENETES